MKRRLFGLSTLIVLNLVVLAVIGAIAVARSKPQYIRPPQGGVYPPIVMDNWYGPPVAIGPSVAIGGVPYANIQPVGPVPDYSQENNAPNVLPQTSNRVVMRRDDPNKRVVVTWEGEPRAVRRIVMATIDKNKHTIESKTITRLPATANLARTSKVAACGIYIEYINGASNTYLITTF